LLLLLEQRLRKRGTAARRRKKITPARNRRERTKLGKKERGKKGEDFWWEFQIWIWNFGGRVEARVWGGGRREKSCP
jgi:hypothetical protein